MSSENPKLVVVAGPNGSGKTTLTTVLMEQMHFVGEYINPDEIAQNVFGDWNSLEASIKAAQRADEIRDDCLVNRRDFLFETVLSTQNKVEFILKAKNAGYHVELFFVSTCSPCINASRVAARVMGGGHTVPIEKIISRYAKSMINCAALLPHLDRVVTFDNSVEDVVPRELFCVEQGVLSVQYQEVMPEWAEQMAAKLHPQTAQRKYL